MAELLDDLLNKGGDSKQQTKTSTAKVDYNLTLDKMRTELAVEKDPAQRQKILTATLDSIRETAVEDKDNLLTAIKALTDFQDSIGVQFEGFLKMTDQELAVIKIAEKALADAEAAKVAAAQVPDTWWQRLWGREKRIVRTEEAVKNAQKALEDAGNLAKQMHRTRMEQAGIETLLDEYSFRSSKLCAQLKEREEQILQVETDIKDQIKEANRIHGEALKLKEKFEGELEVATALQKQENAGLEAITDKQSKEYSDQLAKVSAANQKVEELKSKLNQAMALASSKDSFVHKHDVTARVLTTIRGNLATHRTKLQSDTEERVFYYQGYTTALKARNDQELASILEKLGVKTDENIASTLAQMLTGSAKARQEMMESIPEHEKYMAGIYSALAESLSVIRKKDADIKENFENRFGIDVSKFFEESYDNTNGASNDADKGSTGNAGSTGKGKTAEELIG